MAKQLPPQPDPAPPMIYQIRLKGHLGTGWADWFAGLSITLEDNGDTLLTGPVVDQAALHSLLKKVCDLGMPLISVSPVEPRSPTTRGTGQADAPDVTEYIGVSGLFTPASITTRSINMNTYRMNAVMAGILYFLGTVFGVLGGVIGGDVFASIILGTPLTGVDMLGLVAANASQLTSGAFFTLMMGISLMAMTVFLYPVFRRDSEELALGMLLFRGALEGTSYFISTLGFLTLVALGNEYVATGADSTALQSMGNVLYQFLDIGGAVSPIVFLIGATCLYLSFYRTRLIPRWLTIWGLIGVVPYMAYALLHVFHIDNGIGFYLQMVLGPQEIVMGLWLVIKGFNRSAIAALPAKPATNELLSAA